MAITRTPSNQFWAGGKSFTLFAKTGSKKLAQSYADEQRGKGHLARVVPTRSGIYGVYVRWQGTRGGRR